MTLNRVQSYLNHRSLPQLAVFEACARLGSFTRAAEELHMAQPTVSTQIRKLSETIGLPLFEQIGKRIHRTEAGHLLYEACLTIFRTVEDMEKFLALGADRLGTSRAVKLLNGEQAKGY